MFIFVDVMVALLVGSAPLGRDVRRCQRIAAETGELPPLTTRHANSIALLITGVGAALIIGEYALAYHK